MHAIICFLQAFAGFHNISGDNNTFIGAKPNYFNTADYNNTFIGEESDTNNTTRRNNLNTYFFVDDLIPLFQYFY